MTNTINLGGKDRPISFSHAMAYHFEVTTGKKYLAELDSLFKEFAAANDDDTDIVEAVKGISYVRLVDIAYAALTLGCREQQKNVDFDSYQVAEWLNADSGAVTSLIVALSDSLPKPDENGQAKGDEGKKEATPTE